jgi:cytochrome c553
MKAIQRLILVVIALLITVTVVSVIIAYGISESRINRTHDLDAGALTLQAGPRDRERGERLVTGILQCASCHDRDLGGKIAVDTSIGRVVAPNITKGRGSVTLRFQDTDWVRAIRHGLKADMKGLWIMPTDRFRHLNDRDLADSIAFLGSLKPVDRDLGESSLDLLGRLVHALGKLDLIAVDTMNPEVLERAPKEGDSVAQGRYLAMVGGCGSCHGPDLRGEGLGQEGAVPDLAGPGFRAWVYGDFERAMRLGLRPDDQSMSDAMPWPEVGKLNDEELRSLWDFLRSLPDAATGS